MKSCRAFGDLSSGALLPRMEKFVTLREAKEYLIERILRQAAQDGLSPADTIEIYVQQQNWGQKDSAIEQDAAVIRRKHREC